MIMVFLGIDLAKNMFILPQRRYRRPGVCSTPERAARSVAGDGRQTAAHAPSAWKRVRARTTGRASSPALVIPYG